MKPSRYNHIVRRRGRQPAIYNSRSHRILELDAVQQAIYNGLQIPITRGLMNPRDPAMEKFLGALCENRMAVEENYDELPEVQLRSNLVRFGRSRLSLWLQLTTRCQAGCAECPYREGRLDAGDAARQRLLDLIASRVPELQALELTLWGGDPFLAWPAWRALEREIAALSRQHKFEWSCRIVANAVPRDFGEKELAGIDRLLLNDPSFAGTAAAPVTFLTDFKRVADRHGGFAAGTSMRFIPNQPSAGLCRNLNGLCQSVPEFTDEEYDIIRRLVLEGVAVENLPRPKHTACQAVDPQSYIIDTAGAVYKCWNDAGKPEADCAAALDDPFAPQLFRWMSWDPFRQQHCRACNILPWCQGGCIAKPANEDCGHWRYALRELLKLVIMSKEKRGE